MTNQLATITTAAELPAAYTLPAIQLASSETGELSAIVQARTEANAAQFQTYQQAAAINSMLAITQFATSIMLLMALNEQQQTKAGRNQDAADLAISQFAEANGYSKSKNKMPGAFKRRAVSAKALVIASLNKQVPELPINGKAEDVKQWLEQATNAETTAAFLGECGMLAAPSRGKSSAAKVTELKAENASLQQQAAEAAAGQAEAEAETAEAKAEAEAKQAEAEKAKAEADKAKADAEAQAKADAEAKQALAAQIEALQEAETQGQREAAEAAEAAAEAIKAAEAEAAKQAEALAKLKADAEAKQHAAAEQQRISDMAHARAEAEALAVRIGELRAAMPKQDAPKTLVALLETWEAEHAELTADAEAAAAIVAEVKAMTEETAEAEA